MSGRLPNAKHELFAQALADGKSQFEAHGIAGYKAHRGNASLLAQDKSIVARVAELLKQRETAETKAIAKAIEISGVTKAAIIAELAKLGFSNMLDYMRVGADGDPVLDFSALSRDQAAALVEVTVEDFKDGRGEEARDVRKVKFKLADKRSALVDIGKELGMFIDRKEIRTGPLETKSEDELDRIIRGAAAEAQISLGASGEGSETKH